MTTHKLLVTPQTTKEFIMTTRLTLSLLLLAVLCSPLSAETVTFKQDLPAGTYYSTMLMNTDQTMDTGPMGPMTSKIKMLMVAKYDVSQADAQGMRQVRFNYERIVQDMSAMGGAMVMSYDSDNPQAAGGQGAMLAQVYQPMLEAKFVITMDKDGQVTQVQGVDEMLQAMGQKNPQSRAMLAGMKEAFGKEAIAKMINQARDFMPDKPVAVGESWTNQQTISAPMIGDLQLESTSTLVDLSSDGDGRVAEIDIKGTATSSGAAQAANLPTGGAMDIKDMNIDQTGKLFVNPDTGLAKRVVIDQTTTMTMDVNAPQGQAAQGQQPQAMTMKMNQKSNIVMTQSRSRDKAAEAEFIKTMGSGSGGRPPAGGGAR
jgi:hypothetical protein